MMLLSIDMRHGEKKPCAQPTTKMPPRKMLRIDELKDLLRGLRQVEDQRRRTKFLQNGPYVPHNASANSNKFYPTPAVNHQALFESSAPHVPYIHNETEDIESILKDLNPEKTTLTNSIEKAVIHAANEDATNKKQRIISKQSLENKELSKFRAHIDTNVKRLQVFSNVLVSSQRNAKMAQSILVKADKVKKKAEAAALNPLLRSSRISLDDALARYDEALTYSETAKARVKSAQSEYADAKKGVAAPKRKRK